MIWPFRKRRPAVRDCRILSEDWQIGDLAECIADGFVDSDEIDPKKGDVLRVSDVCEGINPKYNVRFIGLRFESKPQHRGWDNRGFRKIRPEQKAADQSWSEWLRDALTKPVHVS